MHGAAWCLPLPGATVPGMDGWSEWRAWWWHNFAGHFIGYCLVWPVSPRLAQLIHEATMPADDD